LHHARETLALAHADHIDVLHAFENVSLHLVTGFLIGGVFQLDLAEVFSRPDARLGGVTDQPERAELRLDLAEAQLHRVVPVALDGLDLRDRARPGLDNGHGHDRALVVVDAGHADFSSEQCWSHDTVRHWSLVTCHLSGSRSLTSDK